jgi:hypothetical protein
MNNINGLNPQEIVKAFIIVKKNHSGINIIEFDPFLVILRDSQFILGDSPVISTVWERSLVLLRSSFGVDIVQGISPIVEMTGSWSR